MMSKSYPARFSIYWTPLDPTIGAEMQKTRPCVVVSPDTMNSQLGTVIVAPLTSTINKFASRLTVTMHNKKSSIACDQLRMVSKKRIGQQFGVLPRSDQRQLLGIIQDMFTL